MGRRDGGELASADFEKARGVFGGGVEVLASVVPALGLDGFERHVH